MLRDNVTRWATMLLVIIGLTLLAYLAPSRDSDNGVGAIIFLVILPLLVVLFSRKPKKQ